MRPLTPFIASFFIALALFLPGCDDTKARCQEVFEQYLEADERGDGEAILQLIDPLNIEHAEQVLDLARHGSGPTIRNRTAADRLVIGFLRARFKPEELAKLDGRTLVKMKYDTGLYGVEDGEDDVEITLGRFTIRKPRASAELLADGQRTGIRIEFVKVDDRWLVNDEWFDEFFNQNLPKVTRFFRVSEDQFLLNLISRAVGRQVKADVWDTPKGQ